MKVNRPSAREKCLAKSPNLAVETYGNTFRIVLTTRSGRHTVGEAGTEEGAWQSATNFYGIK